MSKRPTSEDFEALGLRVGTVLRAEWNDGARDPACKLWIDLGEEEPAQSSAKITDLYELEELVGRSAGRRCHRVRTDAGGRLPFRCSRAGRPYRSGCGDRVA